MTINEKILLSSDVMDCAAERTKQDDITGYQPIYNPWHLTKDGKTLSFNTQKAIAKYLGISHDTVNRSYKGKSNWLKDSGYTLIKLELVDGKVRIKQ